jgi:hypothetical protein
MPAVGWARSDSGDWVPACEQHATSHKPPSHVNVTAGQLLRLRQLGPGDEVAPELLPAATVAIGRAGWATKAGVYSWTPQGGWEHTAPFFDPVDEPPPDAFSNQPGPPPKVDDLFPPPRRCACHGCDHPATSGWSPWPPAHLTEGEDIPLRFCDRHMAIARGRHVSFRAKAAGSNRRVDNPVDTTNVQLARIAMVLERAAGVQELHIANWPDPSAPARFTGPCEGCGCRLRIARGELAGICPGCGYDPSEEPRARPPSAHPLSEPNSTERQLKADLAAAAPPDDQR